jgi:hypothetical protein
MNGLDVSKGTWSGSRSVKLMPGVRSMFSSSSRPEVISWGCRMEARSLVSVWNFEGVRGCDGETGE